MSRKVALIIGNSEFEDENLARLVTPNADVDALAEVLRDPEIGAFDQVAALVNQPASMIRRAISAFFVGQRRDDLLLLYFSGHGIRDDRGQLFLAVKDTEHKLLRGTAIAASYITEEMDNSRSRRQVLILDCCHSGAFSRGIKAATGASVGTAAAFEGTGSGRVVLTATDSTQYAWEGDRVIGQAENSVFTHYLIQGLRTGEADSDTDGQITLDELYNYVYEQVVHETPLQTPGKWSYGQRGEMVIARNPHLVVRPVELPPELVQAIESPFTGVREGAMRELERLLESSQPGLAQAARSALEGLAKDDSRRVSATALAILSAAQARNTAGVIAVGEVEDHEEKNVERFLPEISQLAAVSTDRVNFIQEVSTEDKSIPSPVFLGANGRQLLFALLATAGWTLGFFVTVAVYVLQGQADNLAALPGALGGLLSGLLWRVLHPDDQKAGKLKLMGLLAGAGAVIGFITTAIGYVVAERANYAHVPFTEYWTFGDLVGWLSGWALFGVAAGAAVRWLKPQSTQEQALWFGGGWALAGLAGVLANVIIPDVAIDLVAGDAKYVAGPIFRTTLAALVTSLVGSGIMLWRAASGYEK